MKSELEYLLDAIKKMNCNTTVSMDALHQLVINAMKQRDRDVSAQVWDGKDWVDSPKSY